MAKAKNFVDSVNSQIRFVASEHGKPDPAYFQSKMKGLAPLILTLEYISVGVSQRVGAIPRATLSPGRLRVNALRSAGG